MARVVEMLSQLETMIEHLVRGQDQPRAAQVQAMHLISGFKTHPFPDLI